MQWRNSVLSSAINIFLIHKDAVKYYFLSKFWRLVEYFTSNFSFLWYITIEWLKFQVFSPGQKCSYVLLQGKCNPAISNVTRVWPSVKQYTAKGKLKKYIPVPFLKVNLHFLAKFDICRQEYVALYIEVNNFWISIPLNTSHVTQTSKYCCIVWRFRDDRCLHWLKTLIIASCQALKAMELYIIVIYFYCFPFKRKKYRVYFVQRKFPKATEPNFQGLHSKGQCLFFKWTLVKLILKLKGKFWFLIINSWRDTFLHIYREHSCFV